MYSIDPQYCWKFTVNENFFIPLWFIFKFLLLLFSEAINNLIFLIKISEPFKNTCFEGENINKKRN